MPIHFFKHINPDFDQAGDIIKYAAAEELDNVVEGFYVYDGAAHPGGRQLFFNDGFPVLVFMPKHTAVTTIHTGGQQRTVSHVWVCAGVVRNTYCESTFPDEKCLVVRFYPQAFFTLFNQDDAVGAKEQIFNFSDIAGPQVANLYSDFYKTSSIAQQISVVSKFLIQVQQQSTAIRSPKILEDILLYIDSQPVLTVKDLLLGYAGSLNYKWLERNFKRYIGTSPKEYLLMKRFLAAYLDLQPAGTKDLMQVALTNGYYDDNHFIKDFRKFSGMPPKAYFQL
ncbi:helix-turn-helix domain-containing protein [Sphingobacterium sp. Mn56C]|uniref:helix-turn-helix domain-containing protein n=1 Tax=Sphingobacterium sp. Mn56C TaxID=3395261 RepID=UPI003BD0838D